MKFKPKHYQQPIINKRVWFEIFIYGFIMSIALLIHYAFTKDAHGAVAASSVIFMAMVVYEFARLIDIRSDYKMKFWSNKLLMGSLVMSMLIQLSILYVPFLASTFNVQPIAGTDWLIIAGVSVVLFAIMKLLNPLLDRIGPEYAPEKAA
jgi:Ca2+-transporting ATPase